jgi:hypothetical protein
MKNTLITAIHVGVPTAPAIMKSRGWIFILIIISNFILGISKARAEAEAIQTPAVVQVELQNYQDRFATTLQDECPGHLCSLVGCEVISFLTLDQQQDASLPGLESTQELVKNPQYKLSSVRCEFTYENMISEQELNSMRQRIVAKTKLAGTTLSLVARKLTPKSAALVLKPENNSLADKNLTEKMAVTESRWAQLAPWMVFAALLSFLALLLIWGVRRIGKPRPINMITPDETKQIIVEPSAQMIMSRIQLLKEKLNTTTSLTSALKPLIQKAELKILCQVLRHFGSEVLIGFNDKIEYQETLMKLREAYQNFTEEESNTEVWQFLDKVERYIVAREVGVDENSLVEEFLFIQNLEASEFFHLLQSVEEEDVALLLSFAPAYLQNTFFKQLNSEQLVTLIDKISQTKDLSDKVVREKAKAIRDIYQNRRAELKTIPLDRLPMLEQLLNSMNSNKRNQLLQEMKTQNMGLFQNLLGHMFMDKSLTLMSKEALNEIFVSVPPNKAAAYLDSLPYREEILGRLNPVLANSIRRHTRPQISESLDFNFNKGEAFSESIIDSMNRNEVAQVVREQVQKGLLNLRTINENLINN